jgi:hypothetical protein
MAMPPMMMMGPPGWPRASRFVCEFTHDPDAGDPDVCVFRHQNLDGAHDRDRVNGHGALGVPGFAQVDLTSAAHYRQAHR